MASNVPKILTLELEATETETKVIFKYGLKTVEKSIPNGHGLVRANTIFDGKTGDLWDVELVTAKS